MPAMQAPRYVRHTASSFIASKLGSYKYAARHTPHHRSSRASSAPTDTRHATHRVIVHREQARLLQIRGTPHTASSFIASKLGSHRGTRCGRQTESSLFAGKPRSNRRPRTRWSEACPRIVTPRSQDDRISKVGAVLARESCSPREKLVSDVMASSRASSAPTGPK